MCGLLGASVPKGKKVDMDLIKILYLANESRGGDACGFSDGKSMNKTTDKSYQYIIGKEFPKEINGSFIGHTRAATVGNKTDIDCAHPFDLEKFVGAHNGTIRNIDELQYLFGTEYKVDSRFIYHMVEKYGLNKSLPFFQGALSLTYIDKETKDISIYRFERPLHYGFVDGVLYYSSEDIALKAIGATNITEFKEHKFYKLSGGAVVHQRMIKKSLMPTKDPADRKIIHSFKELSNLVRNLKDQDVSDSYAIIMDDIEKEKKQKEEDTKTAEKEGLTLLPKPDKKESGGTKPPAYAMPFKDTFANGTKVGFWWFSEDNANTAYVYLRGDTAASLYDMSQDASTQSLKIDFPDIVKEIKENYMTKLQRYETLGLFKK